MMTFPLQDNDTRYVKVEGTLETESNWVETVIVLLLLGIIFVFGTVVNAIVFLVFYKRPSLRSISNRFVLSLTSANLVSTVVVVPVQALGLGGVAPGLGVAADEELLAAVGGERMTGGTSVSAAAYWWCQVAGVIMTLAVEAAILSVLLIAVDRYCAVTSPLHYSMTITGGRSVRLIVGVWAVAILYSSPPFLAHFGNQSPFSFPDQHSCQPGRFVAPRMPRRFGVFYAAMLAGLGFLVPFFILCWIYVKMYHVAQRNSERTRRHSVSANPNEIIIPDCPSTPDSGNHNSVRGKNRLHRRRSSNTSFSSLFFREEGRAVKTGVIVLSSFLTSWMPYFVLKIFESDIWTYAIPHHVEVVIYLLALSATCTMPFIYVYRNETASKEALKIIFWWRPPSPATPTFSRSSLHAKLSNGHSSTPPSRLHDPDTNSLYSYASECRECGTNQLVCSLRNGRPFTAPIGDDQRRSYSPRRESSVSFRLTPLDNRPSSRCRQCLRQDSASSASSDDPLLGDCNRHPRLSNASVRWNRPRMSNGSVTTRSDSLASTNSSLVSCALPRWPVRRYSTVSTDSGGTITRRSALDESEELSECNTLTVEPPRRSSTGHRALFVENNENERTPVRGIPINVAGGYGGGVSGSEMNHPEIHGYANPFRHPRIYRRQESVGSSVRFIWEIEEGESREDETPEAEEGVVKSVLTPVGS